MPNGKRVTLAKAIEAEILIRSRRRCALCFGLSGDLSEKPGQIAHIDRQRTNDDPNNLCYLCLPHHDEYDSRRSQTKSLTAAELRHYRDELLAHIAATRGASSSTSAVPSTDAEFEHIVLLPAEVAIILRCPESEIQKLLDAGSIAAFRVAGEWRVPSQAVINYLAERIRDDQLQLLARNVLDPKAWASALRDMPDFERKIRDTQSTRPTRSVRSCRRAFSGWTSRTTLTRY